IVVIKRQSFGKLPEHLRQRERLTQVTGLRREGKYVVTHHHAEGQCHCSFVLIVQPLSVEAYIIEPPGVSLIKPIPERRVVKPFARYVSIVEYGFEIFFREALGIILYQGCGFGM